jgi:glycosyltransferase involved in cell wall biosynthesis
LSPKVLELAILSTHPIQYYSPWYKALSDVPGLNVTVHYCTFPKPNQQGAGFQQSFEWDIPLLDGYQWRLFNSNKNGVSLDRVFWLRVGRNGNFSGRKPDAVLVTGWHAIALVQLAYRAKKKGIPVLVRGDSNNIEGERSLIKRILHKRLFRLYRHYLYVGELNRKFYQSYNIPESALTFCPHFVDNHRFSAAAEQLRVNRITLRRKWSIPDNGVCFLFVGKLHKKKNVLDLINDFSLHKNDKNMHLLMVGDGDQRSEAEKLASDRSIPITFTGFLNQKEVVQAYAVSDCLVLPSDHGETWGLVVNEAMACGLPALVSDKVGCAPDLVEAGVTGEIFAFGNIREISQKMTALASDIGRLKAMGQNGKKKVHTEYRSDRAVEGTLTALEAVKDKGSL